MMENVLFMKKARELEHYDLSPLENVFPFSKSTLICINILSHFFMQLFLSGSPLFRPVLILQVILLNSSKLGSFGLKVSTLKWCRLKRDEATSLWCKLIAVRRDSSENSYNAEFKVISIHINLSSKFSIIDASNLKFTVYEASSSIFNTSLMFSISLVQLEKYFSIYYISWSKALSSEEIYQQNAFLNGISD